MDTTSFQHTAQKLWPELLAIARKYGGADEDAEDAAQETLVRLWRISERLASEDEAARMARRIIRNYCIDRKRRNKEVPVTAADLDAEASTLMPSSPSPEDGMIAAEGEAALRQAIASLTPAERRLYTLRHEAGFEVQAIAAMTGTQPRSVSAMLSAVRRKLILELQHYLNDGQ